MGPLRLTLLRHGQAQAGEGSPEDFQRALTHRGTLEAQEMAARILRRDLVPDLIIASPAERTWATAAIIAGVCELDASEIRAARELYLASSATLWRVLTQKDLTVRHLLICGHNPSLSQIASRLGPHPQPRQLPTAGLATAIWQAADWTHLEPESAGRCDFDDPQTPADAWG